MLHLEKKNAPTNTQNKPLKNKNVRYRNECVGVNVDSVTRRVRWKIGNYLILHLHKANFHSHKR